MISHDFIFTTLYRQHEQELERTLERRRAVAERLAEESTTRLPRGVAREPHRPGQDAGCPAIAR